MGTKSALPKDNEVRKKTSVFRYRVPHCFVNFLRTGFISKWHLIQNQPLLREMYKEPLIISYKKAKSLRDILLRAKL